MTESSLICLSVVSLTYTLRLCVNTGSHCSYLLYSKQFIYCIFSINLNRISKSSAQWWTLFSLTVSTAIHRRLMDDFGVLITQDEQLADPKDELGGFPGFCGYVRHSHSSLLFTTSEASVTRNGWVTDQWMGKHMITATSSTLERPIDPYSVEYNNISLEQHVTLQFLARLGACVCCFVFSGVCFYLSFS